MSEPLEFTWWETHQIGSPSRTVHFFFVDGEVQEFGVRKKSTLFVICCSETGLEIPGDEHQRFHRYRCLREAQAGVEKIFEARLVLAEREASWPAYDDEEWEWGEEEPPIESKPRRSKRHV